MAAELLRTESDGTLSFGDYTLNQKAKLEDYEHNGDLYKVKTYATMTKLEKNGMFAYESEPGTSVSFFKETESGVEFNVSGASDAEITIGLKEDTEYEIYLDGKSIGKMTTNLGGKLSLSVELSGTETVNVKVTE
ncbi:MAG: endosialidase [Lachnospiraceae bacterium]|nr:endosialidase [Lachnospiraceae bacterium]